MSVASSVLKHATHRTMNSSLVKRHVNDQQYFCIKQALIFIFFVYSLSIYCSISKSIFSVAAASSVDWIYYCMQGICSSGFKIKKMNKRKKKSKLWLASYIKSIQVQHKQSIQRAKSRCVCYLFDRNSSQRSSNRPIWILSIPFEPEEFKASA